MLSGNRILQIRSARIGSRESEWAKEMGSGNGNFKEVWDGEWTMGCGMGPEYVNAELE